VSLELNQLIELQELDLEIQRIHDRLSKIPAERDQIESVFSQYAAEFLDLKSKYDQTLEDRTQLEAELATTQQHHDKFKQDLMRVTNTKEYETVLREIDATKKHAGALESEILKRMEELDKLEAEVAQKAPDVDRKRVEVDESLAALESEQDEAGRDLARYHERRSLLAQQLPKQLFSTYDRMARSRRGQALAEIRSDGICSVCRIKVRAKVFSDVRKGDQMITCENCGRILYYRAEPSQSAEAAMSQQGTTEQ
jgi:predicted  nucleic acid-binding Zn-ribbon protein